MSEAPTSGDASPMELFNLGDEHAAAARIVLLHPDDDLTNPARLLMAKAVDLYLEAFFGAKGQAPEEARPEDAPALGQLCGQADACGLKIAPASQECICALDQGQAGQPADAQALLAAVIDLANSVFPFVYRHYKRSQQDEE